MFTLFVLKFLFCIYVTKSARDFQKQKFWQTSVLGLGTYCLHFKMFYYHTYISWEVEILIITLITIGWAINSLAIFVFAYDFFSKSTIL